MHIKCCQFCTNREIDCHSTCAVYKQERKTLDQQSELMRTEKQKMSNITITAGMEHNLKRVRKWHAK